MSTPEPSWSIPKLAKVATNTVLRGFGYQIRRWPAVDAAPVSQTPAEPELPPDFDEADKALWERVKPFTMTSPERVYGLRRYIQYVLAHEIPGAFVECGCWKGGSAMAMAICLLECGVQARDIYLYDTFEAGWPEGGEDDVTMFGETAHELYEKALASGETPETLFCRKDAVEDVVRSTGYPPDRIHLVAGRVEHTIPEQAPSEIALLRLDTDWYESTRHEWTHLYPRLSQRGVVIVDDYGYFKGARKATDEYLAEHRIPMALHRLDLTCRVGIKP